MGYGSWTSSSFRDYSVAKGMSVDLDGSISGSYSSQDMFKSRRMDEALDPCGAMRECRDSAEHPETIPVILALDVTGSMGSTAVEVAKKLNIVMTKLYSQIKGVQFMVMGIGDFAYDRCPLQVSQFESDIRIAEQLDKLYFEYGGGGNSYESYTAAWYFASRHTNLDCWKRGKKGIIITMGDEELNPYIPLYGNSTEFATVTGDNLQAYVETSSLYEETSEKFDIYHLNVSHRSLTWGNIPESFGKYLDTNHFFTVGLNDIADKIVDIIVAASQSENTELSPAETGTTYNENREISW